MDLSLWPLNSIARLGSFGRSPYLWQMGPTKKPRIRLPSFLKSRQYLPPRDRTSFCRATTAPLRRLTPLRAPHATHRKSSNGSEGIRFTSCTLASDESGGLPAATDEGSLGILRGRQQDRGHTCPRLASRNSRRARSRLVTSSPCEKPATRLSSDEKFGYSAAKISARPSPQGRVIRSFTHGPRFAKGFVDASGIVPLLLVPERCHRIDSASSPRRNPAASVATLNKSAGTPMKTGGWNRALGNRVNGNCEGKNPSTRRATGDYTQVLANNLQGDPPRWSREPQANLSGSASHGIGNHGVDSDSHEAERKWSEYHEHACGNPARMEVSFDVLRESSHVGWLVQGLTVNLQNRPLVL
jgi:hypothetical protein